MNYYASENGQAEEQSVQLAGLYPDPDPNTEPEGTAQTDEGDTGGGPKPFGDDD